MDAGAQLKEGPVVVDECAEAHALSIVSNHLRTNNFRPDIVTVCAGASRLCRRLNEWRCAGAMNLGSQAAPKIACHCHQSADSLRCPMIFNSSAWGGEYRLKLTANPLDSRRVCVGARARLMQRVYTPRSRS